MSSNSASPHVRPVLPRPANGGGLERKDKDMAAEIIYQKLDWAIPSEELSSAIPHLEEMATEHHTRRPYLHYLSGDGAAGEN